MHISKKITFLCLVIFSFGLLSIQQNSKKKMTEEELAACIVKSHSEWGTQCQDCGEFKGYDISYDATYKVYLTSQCDEHLDLKACIQEEDGSWKCFHYEDLTTKDTLVAWACKGTGKYLKWVKPAGDRELIFPTNKEVQELYPPKE